MPPHEILGSLYQHPEIFYPLFVGEPGRIEKYWRENVDLHEALDTPDIEPWHLYKEYKGFSLKCLP